MQHIEPMLQSHPQARGQTTPAITECIIACLDCLVTCTACSDACLAEPNAGELSRCIRLNQQCADICITTALALSRVVQPDWSAIRSLVQACAAIAADCAAECELHAAHMKHCRICAEACRACERTCQRLLPVSLQA